MRCSVLHRTPRSRATGSDRRFDHPRCRPAPRARERVVDHVLVVAHLAADEDDASLASPRARRAPCRSGSCRRASRPRGSPSAWASSTRSPLARPARTAQLAGRRRPPLDLLGGEQRLEEAGDEIVGSSAPAGSTTAQSVPSRRASTDRAPARPAGSRARRRRSAARNRRPRRGGRVGLRGGVRSRPVEHARGPRARRRATRPVASARAHPLQRRRSTSAMPIEREDASGSDHRRRPEHRSPCSAVTKNWLPPGLLPRGAVRRSPRGSRASHATVFTNRSLLPRYSMKKLFANSALP